MDAKKVVPLVLIAGGVAVLARNKFGLRTESSTTWGRIIERMPDDAPPKWMINNISALREEHERIVEQNERILDGLQRLGQEHGDLIGARGGGEGGDD